MKLIQVLKGVMSEILKLEARNPAQKKALDTAWDGIKTAATALAAYYAVTLDSDHEEW